MADPSFENLANLDVTSKRGGVSKIDPASIPGFIPNKPSKGMDNYRVRYLRANLQDAGELIELERIETDAIRGRGVYILSKERFLFMDQILILVSYLEEIPD